MYITQARCNVVVPHSWLNDIDSHIENLINNGVNSNRKFKVFWSEKPAALDADGIPLASYKPVTLSAHRYKYPEEGWYECQIRRFKSEFNIFS